MVIVVDAAVCNLGDRRQMKRGQVRARHGEREMAGERWREREGGREKGGRRT